MGMFDTIRVPCPDCKKPVECQSKSGDCNLDYFELDEINAGDAPYFDEYINDCNRHGPHVVAVSKSPSQPSNWSNLCSSTESIVQSNKRS